MKRWIAGGLLAAMAVGFTATGDAQARDGILSKLLNKRRGTTEATETAAPPMAEEKKDGSKKLPAGEAKKQSSAVPLFNGKNLDGWNQKGGMAKYRVENGEIIGTSVPNTSNSFLCTNKDYGNFILEVDFKVNPTLNSGIQIRSQSYDKETKVTIQGKEFKFPAGRVHGYQCEIDPSDRAYSGGIYDEGRRGWLNDLKNNEPARKAFKKNEWNHFRIECKGDSIKTFINGVPAADLKDSVTPKGFIALQVHGVGNKTEPLEVRWKNITIEELK